MDWVELNYRPQAYQATITQSLAMVSVRTIRLDPAERQ
jgi:hypothetical protein